MRYISKTMTSWLLLSTIITGLFVWFVLPWVSIADVPVFQPVWIRVAILIIVLIFATILEWSIYGKHKRRERALIESMGESSAVQEDTKAHFKQLFIEINQVLSQQHKVKQPLYKSPWYLVIGASGTGKSTLLRKSGLDFVGTKESIEKKGLAGTVLCDWWVSPDMVLLDTAGRLTSQDHQQTDTDDWQQMLTNLSKQRPLQPLNGVILTLPADVLLSQIQLNDYIQMLIRRITEIDVALSMRLPIYLFVTKIDLLPGFDACFYQFEASELQKVWGYAVEDGSGNAEELSVKLQDWVYARQSSMATDTAQQSLLFNHYFRGLSKRLDSLVTHLISTFPTNIHFRGVFFTSATQEGNPVVKAFSNVITNDDSKSLCDVSLRHFTKSYFIKDALTNVILGESTFAGRAVKYINTRKRITWLTSGILVLAIGGLNYLWWKESKQLSTYVENIQQKFENNAIAFEQNPTLKGALNFLSELEQIKEDGEESTVTTLYTKDTLNNALSSAQSEIYSNYIVPNLLEKIRRTLLEKNSEQLSVYSNLKAYLILSSGQYFDSKFLQLWFNNNSSLITEDRLSEQQNAQLVKHSYLAIMSPREQSYNVDKSAIEKARQELNSISPGKRLLLALESNKSLPVWDKKILEAASNVDKYLRRDDGISLSTLPSSLYSQSGILWLVQQNIEDIAEAYAREGWVLSDTEQLKVSNAKEIVNAMMLDYIVGYTSSWLDYLSDISLRQKRDLSQLVIQLDPLADIESDFYIWLNAVMKQLYVPEGLSKQSKIIGFDKLLTKQFENKFNELSLWSSLEKNNTGMLKMSQRFIAIKKVIEEQIASSASDVEKHFVIRKQFDLLITELPNPLKDWFDQLYHLVSSAMMERANIALNVSWSDNFELCKRTISGTYPFTKNSKADVSLAEFVGLFGKTGIFESFSQSHSDIGNRLSDNSAFQSSRKIASSYFIAGDNPTFDFSIRLQSMSENIKSLYISVGGDTIEYESADGQWLHARWPLHSAASSVSFRLLDEFNTPIWDQGYYGLWAVHRMVDKLGAVRLGSGNYLIKKSGSGWSFAIELSAPERNDLLLLKAIRKFKCPEEL